MERDIIKNLIYTILIPLMGLLLGMVLIFILIRMLPGDPVLAYLPPSFTQEQYNAIVHMLGFDQPIFIQFFRFLGDLLTGNLGVSGTISMGQPVFGLLIARIPLSLEFTVLPVLLGLFLGILFGILSVRIRYKLVKGLFQVLIILGISIPVFFVGMWTQYIFAFQLGILPAIGDPFLPSFILFLLTTFLTTRQVRSNYLKKPEEKHILSNSMHLLINTSVLFASILLLEVTFGIHGFFELFLIAIISNDYYVVRGVIFIILLLPVIILLISNGIYTIYNLFLETGQSRIFSNTFGRTDQMIEEGARYDLESDQGFKDYALNRLISPLTIIGLLFFAVTVILAFFPQILTPLTMEQAQGIYPGSWEPSSTAHPLGTANFGRDVLALLAYGISTTIIVSILTVLVGIVVGSLLGYLAKVHRWLNGLVLGFLVVLIIIPSIAMILIFLGILGRDIMITMSLLSLFLIPAVALLISRGNYSLKSTVKKLIAYFPLFMGINIMVFEAIGFLGQNDPMTIQLGASISSARGHLYDAPWAAYWPGLALFVINIGLFTLHYGLKEPIQLFERSREVKLVSS